MWRPRVCSSVASSRRAGAEEEKGIAEDRAVGVEGRTADPLPPARKEEDEEEEDDDDDVDNLLGENQLSKSAGARTERDVWR